MTIAYDATSAGAVVTDTSNTWAHTCSATGNRILFVNTYEGSATQTISVTYNGVSMVSLASVNRAGGAICTLWYLIAPASGAHNIVISAASAVPMGGTAASYTGVNQSAPTNFTTNSHATGTSLATSLTLTVNNWAVLGGVVNNSILSADTGSTVRTVQDSTHGIFDSNGAPGAGSYSMAIKSSDANSTWIEAVMAEITPPNYPLDATTATSYAVTTQGTGFSIGHYIVAAAQSFLSTVFDSTFTLVTKWRKQSKSSSSWSNETKDSSTFSGQSKNSSSWDNQSKT